MSLHIAPFQLADRPSWEVLARAYKDFYNTPTTDVEYSTAWDRLLANDGVHGVSAYVDGQMVGFAHYLFHTSTWVPKACYLQDLFTSPTARGKGVARALIEAVASNARELGATRYYWLTQEHNAEARVLYNKVAKFGGFIRYDYPL